MEPRPLPPPPGTVTSMGRALERRIATLKREIADLESRKATLQMTLANMADEENT
jgi:hypothetical protein